jgi:hypothetical protein
LAAEVKHAGVVSVVGVAAPLWSLKISSRVASWSHAPTKSFTSRYILKEGYPTGRNTMPEKNVNPSINKGEQPL